MEILIDACVIMAVIADEPEKDLVVNLTKNAIIISPNIIAFEIANALTKMMKKKIINKENMILLFQHFNKIPIKKVEINIEKALEIAWDYKIYVYDACYLEAAKRLNLPLLTFDNAMIKIAKELYINILGEKNVSI